jgi:hypothetical protein
VCLVAVKHESRVLRYVPEGLLDEVERRLKEKEEAENGV